MEKGGSNVFIFFLSVGKEEERVLSMGSLASSLCILTINLFLESLNLYFNNQEFKN